MSTKIRKLTKKGVHFYPQTHIEALVSNTGKGIDDTPTPDSQNLVRSGGVFSKITEIEHIEETPGQLAFVEVDADNNITETLDMNRKRTFYGDVDVKGDFEVADCETVGEGNMPNSVIVEMDSEDKIHHYVDKKGIHYFPAGIKGINAINSDKELFVIGDSLSHDGQWPTIVSKETGIKFSQEKNKKAGSLLSCGGTTTFGGAKDCGLARVMNLKKEGYKPDIIVFQNVNDTIAFGSDGLPLPSAGSISDAPYIISQYLGGFSTDNWVDEIANISVADRKFGTAIEMLFDAPGTNLKITQIPSNEGNVTISVTTVNTGTLSYAIHVLANESISSIIAKILEYNFSGVTDTEGTDGESVDFSTGTNPKPTVAFTDTDNTGMQVIISETSTAKGTAYKFFNGTSLNQWTDINYWMSSVTFYRAWKGMIEFCQKNYPNATLCILLFPDNSMNPATYLNPDGTYDQDAYVNSENQKKVKGLYEELVKIANIYKVPVIDAHYNSGVTCANYSSYYWNGNVHPKDAGYQRFGKYIASKLITNI